MRIITLLCCTLMCACASVAIPKFQADSVHCTYDRESLDAQWKCTAEGKAIIETFELF